MHWGSLACCHLSCVTRSPLGSAIAVQKVSGELVAIAHPQNKTGFKNPNAYGAKPVFSSET
jgi:hypothetical protein